MKSSQRRINDLSEWIDIVTFKRRSRRREKEQDINRSASIFETEISAAFRVMGKNQDLSKSKWVGKLSGFMTKVYPIARLSLRLTSAIVDVHPQ